MEKIKIEDWPEGTKIKEHEHVGKTEIILPKEGVDMNKYSRKEIQNSLGKKVDEEISEISPSAQSGASQIDADTYNLRVDRALRHGETHVSETNQDRIKAKRKAERELKGYSKAA